MKKRLIALAHKIDCLKKGQWLKLGNNGYLYHSFTGQNILLGNISPDELLITIEKYDCRNWYLTDSLQKEGSLQIIANNLSKLLHSELLTQDKPLVIITRDTKDQSLSSELFLKVIKEYHQQRLVSAKDSPLRKILYSISNYFDSRSASLVRFLNNKEASRLEWKPGAIELTTENSKLVVKDFGLYEAKRARQINLIFESAGWMGSFKDLPEAVVIQIQ